MAKKLERLAKKKFEVKEDNCENENNFSSDSNDKESEERNELDYEDFGSFNSKHDQDIVNGNNVFNLSDSIALDQSCCFCSCHNQVQPKHKNSKDAFAQTLSTGDIAITKVYFQKNTNKV